MRNIHLPENKFLKVLVIFFALGAGMYVLPFIIGGFLIYFVYKHLDNLVVRNSMLVALALPTLLFGTIWVAGITKGIADPTPLPMLTPTPTPFPTATPLPTEVPTPTSTPSAAPKPTITRIPTPKPTLKPTATPKPYIAPTRVYVPATTAPVTSAPAVQSNPPANTSGSFTCNCAKTCSQMSSCAEAQYQLNVCGCSARDADHDGTACDSQCQ